MKRSHMWGLIAFGIMAVNLGIIAYWNSQFDVVAWDAEYKWYPLYFFFAGIGVLGIAGYYSHKEGDRFDWNR